MPSARVRSAVNVVPDKIDFRDRVYQPSLVRAPSPRLDSLSSLHGKIGEPLPVLDQGNSNACTGFGLASVVNYLRRLSGLEPDALVSAQMLYSMARRYDEFPGSAKEDTGSSVRAALKGWFRHGASSADCWPNEDGKAIPEPDPKHPEKDWWFDAVRRPLGAYFRVETHSISDLHVALCDIGVLYASAICHSGWEEGFEKGRKESDGIWEIPAVAADRDDYGHAFMIYGYDDVGFLIQNSWGKKWGSGGKARLRYADWLANAMDCWVCQIGVTTTEHLDVARAGGLRFNKKTKAVVLSHDDNLRNREISPFIIDMENNGRLSQSGRFRTQESDIHSLLKDMIPKARQDWGLEANEVIDVAIYAHGGLVNEEAAAKSAAKWIPALYKAQIFPIFFFWETGLFKTLSNIFDDCIRNQPRPAGGLLSEISDWWNHRVERLLAAPSTKVWSEIKENARLISTNPKGGGKLLYEINKEIRPQPLSPNSARLHLIGHSAGSIVHSHVAQELAAAKWSFSTVNFMAPAVNVTDFRKTLLPLIDSGQVARYNQFHLQDEAERKDPTCRSILFYGNSLLYFVSEWAEGGKRMPILGMERFFKSEFPKPPKNVVVHTPAAIKSSVSTHGGFDDDDVVLSRVIRCIKEG
jgi:hypothetical protein